jgi:putative two-component system response regulator
MSRALAVADVYEAITADRPYRRGMPRNEALAILRGQAGTALCAESVEALGSELD